MPTYSVGRPSERGQSACVGCCDILHPAGNCSVGGEDISTRPELLQLRVVLSAFVSQADWASIVGGVGDGPSGSYMALKMTQKPATRPMNDQAKIILADASSFVPVEVNNGFGPRLLWRPVVMIPDKTGVHASALGVDQHPVDTVIVLVDIGFHKCWRSM